MVWERRACVSAQVEDATVLLDMESLKYHSLNVTASAVWEMLEQPAEQAKIVQELCRRFEVEPEACSRSVERLLLELEQTSLVSRVSTSAA